MKKTQPNLTQPNLTNIEITQHLRDVIFGKALEVKT
jgi:hypothetical protein